MISASRSQAQKRMIASCAIVLAIFLATISPKILVGATLDSSSSGTSESQVAANHRMEAEDESAPTKQQATGGKRQSRQYDSTMSASNGAGFAAIAADGSAYVSGQSPVGSTNNYGSVGTSSGSNNYANEMSGAYHSSVYHDPLSIASRAYPSPQPGPLGAMYGHSLLGYPPGPAHGYNPVPAVLGQNPGSGFLSSSIFPLMGGKSFEVSEIICTAIAVAVGAVIVGAPFILLYLFFMNQMNGNGASAIGPNGGAISLTGPTSSTTVNGRKKRNTSLQEALFKQISPLVNSEQVASTFKALMSAIAKYQV